MARLYVKGVGKRVLNMYRCMNVIMHQMVPTDKMDNNMDTVSTKKSLTISNREFVVYSFRNALTH